MGCAGDAAGRPVPAPRLSAERPDRGWWARLAAPADPVVCLERNEDDVHGAGEHRSAGHYADAIPLDLHKTEQDRIRAGLDAITHRLDNLATTYADARDGLDQLTSILTDLDDLYAKAEPAERRVLNQALFKKIIIDDDERVTYEPTDAIAGVFAHLDAEVPDDLTPETNLPRDHAGQVSSFSTWVDLRGFEPLTSSLRTKRATNCATGP